MNDLEQDLRDTLVKGANQMLVSLTEPQINKLIAYIQEFHKWNKAYNLSAIRDVRQMVTRHLLDSLSVIPYFLTNKYPTDKVIDVGTGGGLPGIPLAIMFPEKKITLLDSAGKKARFLFHVKTLLKLDNVNVINTRVEEYKPEEKLNAVISRAFASLQDMTEGCNHLLCDDGIFLAMKGIYPQEEIFSVSSSTQLLECIKLDVAETEGERHLLVLQTKQ